MLYDSKVDKEWVSQEGRPFHTIQIQGRSNKRGNQGFVLNSCTLNMSLSVVITEIPIHYFD